MSTALSPLNHQRQPLRTMTVALPVEQSPRSAEKAQPPPLPSPKVAAAAHAKENAIVRGARHKMRRLSVAMGLSGSAVEAAPDAKVASRTLAGEEGEQRA